MTTTRVELESIVTAVVKPVMDAIALFKNESLRNQDAVLEEKLVKRMAGERKELERDRDKRTGDLQNRISDLEKKAIKRRDEDDLARKDAKREADRKQLQMTNRIVYLEASVTQAVEKHHLSEDEWKRRARARDAGYLDEIRRLKGALDTATSRCRRAEQPPDGEVRVVKKLKERSCSGDRRSHDGRSLSSGDRGNTEKGRDNEPSSARKAPTNVLKEPATNDAPKDTTGARKGGEKGDRSQKGEEGGTEPPGGSEDRERTKQHQIAPLGGEGESQERSRDCGQEPMQLTQMPVSPVRVRIGKPWAEDDKQADTGVVDLSNTSFTSVEAAGEATTQGDGEEDVDYELSDEDELSEEDTREPAAAPPVTVAPAIALTKEERRLRKNARAKERRDQVREQELAARNQAVGGEVDDSQALLAVFRGQDSGGTTTIQKRRRVIADDEEEDVPAESKEGSTGEA
jgi:hypothetical protein